MQLCEGELVFSFPDTLSASIYDQWKSRIRFESAFKDGNKKDDCSKGTRAVDFIVLDNKTLWLIEVKDYRNPQKRKKAIPKPSKLSCLIACKIRDTLSGLVVAKMNAKNSNEREFAHQALKKEKIRLVLHLEQSKQHPQIINPIDIQQTLKKLLKKIDPHPLVVSQHNLHKSMKWSVYSKRPQDQEKYKNNDSPIFANFEHYS